VNYEVGVKYMSSSGRTQAEVIAFFNDYSNITGTCTASTGCDAGQLDLQFNGGAALIRGFEGRIAHSTMVRKVAVPVQANVTVLNAEFRNSFRSRTAEWGVGQVVAGDPLPYIPQVQYTVTVGTEYRRWKQEVALIYQGESFDQSVAENRLRVPAFGIVDWTGRYEYDRQTQFFARVDNLLGKDYIASFRPFGARPGKPQSFMVGLSHTF
jgi:Fe(3+) dicitrate transport protein